MSATEYPTKKPTPYPTRYPSEPPSESPVVSEDYYDRDRRTRLTTSTADDTSAPLLDPREVVTTTSTETATAVDTAAEKKD